MARPLGSRDGPDYYFILEVLPSATVSEIKESYRRLALKHHPDKDHDKGATRRFQDLVKAWECLSDAGKRGEYDRVRSWGGDGRWGAGTGMWGEAGDRFDAQAKASEEKSRKRDDLERDAEDWSWASDGGPEEVHFENEEARRARAVVWKAMAREQYRLRLQAWIEFREDKIGPVKEYAELVRSMESELRYHTHESKRDIGRSFASALEQLDILGCESEESAVISELMHAREDYMLGLTAGIEDAKAQLHELSNPLLQDTRRHEEEEHRVRLTCIREAMELLGPRGFKPPLFSVLDRRGLAFNHWNALRRVKAAVKHDSIMNSAEGLWHATGDWERIPGEHICGRCDEKAFHFIAECAPAQCPGCGTVVCNECYRDLRLLQEYEAWILKSDSAALGSLFCLDVDLSDE